MVELAAAALQAEGIAASMLNAREVVWTDARFGSALPDIAAIRRLAPERVGPLLDKGLTPVIQGFIGSEADGATTTLGRGGSDFTAALLGSALGASEVVIWTDVDGGASQVDSQLVTSYLSGRKVCPAFRADRL